MLTLIVLVMQSSSPTNGCQNKPHISFDQLEITWKLLVLQKISGSKVRCLDPEVCCDWADVHSRGRKLEKPKELLHRRLHNK